MIAFMYHDIVSKGAVDTSGFPGKDAARYKVTPAAFADHLRTIFSSPARPAMTFDDGGVSAVWAADMLERYGAHGRFFITTNYVGSRGFVDARDLRDLHERGHVVGSHSCSHPLRFGHCTRPKLIDEWTQSAAALADILGEPVTTGSVPGGDFAPQVAEAAAVAGYTELFTSEPTAEDRRAFGLSLRGRFTVQYGTDAGTIASLLAGDPLPLLRQSMLWNAKKLSKKIGGEKYLALRKLLIGHGDDVRWGDESHEDTMTRRG